MKNFNNLLFKVEIRALRPMLMKDLKKLKNHKINKRFAGADVDESFQAMGAALDSLGPALDLGLAAVKTLFCEAVKELKAMILRKPVYVNHVDIWFLRSMDPLLGIDIFLISVEPWRILMEH